MQWTVIIILRQVPLEEKLLKIEDGRVRRLSEENDSLHSENYKVK